MTEVEFIESLRDAADEAVRPCLRDDLADLASDIQDGDYEGRVEPIQAAIRQHERDIRALELSYWFGRLQYTDGDGLPRLRGLMRERIDELEADQ